jgi:hemolysin D
VVGRVAKLHSSAELLARVQFSVERTSSVPSDANSVSASNSLSTTYMSLPLPPVGLSSTADERQTAALEKAQERQAQLATVSALEAAVRQSEERRSQLTSSYRSDLNSSRMEVVGAIARLEQEDVKAGFRSAIWSCASQEGVVKDLATTTLGAVVQPGTVLLTLVPTQEPLRAEVMIQNKDIGFVQAGQRVRLKVAPYAFQKYGMIEGTVLNVSADSEDIGRDAGSTSHTSRSQAPAPSAFKALIELSQQSLEVGSLRSL